MQAFMMPLQFVQQSIQNGFSRAKCYQIHGGSCNAFCLNYMFRVCRASYKTYAVVYLVQLLFKWKKIASNPSKQGLKYIFDYIKSTSLTAVQMAIMRRILCICVIYFGSKQNNLIIANFLSAFYLLVQSYTRQMQICLYQITNTSLVLYNMAKRRQFIKPLPMGETILFAFSMMVMLYHFFNSRDTFKKNYVYSILTTLFGDA